MLFLKYSSVYFLFELASFSFILSCNNFTILYHFLCRKKWSKSVVKNERETEDGEELQKNIFAHYK